MKTIIQIDKELTNELKLLKLTPRESYNEIVWRLVKENKSKE
jgi:hypothetical protein